MFHKFSKKINSPTQHLPAHMIRLFFKENTVKRQTNLCLARVEGTEYNHVMRIFMIDLGSRTDNRPAFVCSKLANWSNSWRKYSSSTRSPSCLKSSTRCCARSTISTSGSWSRSDSRTKFSQNSLRNSNLSLSIPKEVAVSCINRQRAFRSFNYQKLTTN